MTVSIIVLCFMGVVCAGMALAIQFGAFDDMPSHEPNVGDE